MSTQRVTARIPRRTFGVPLFFRPDGDGVDGGGEGADTRPEWLPSNFKSPEDLAKSYEESRKEMDRLRSQNDEERAQFAAALERMESVQQSQQQQFQAQPGVDPQTQQLLAQYQQAVENQDAAAQLAITLGLQQQMMDQALEARFKTLEPTLNTQSQADRNIAFELGQERVAKQFGDQWEAIQPDVQAWLNEHQAWLPTVNDPAAFEKVVREGADIVLNAKRAEALAAVEADRAAKLSAQGATGAGQGRYPIATDDKKQAWADIASADVGSYGQMRGSK